MERKPLLARPTVAIAIIILALLLDQFIKWVVEAYLPLQEDVPLLPFLALYRTYNLGVAFSMLDHMSGWFIVCMRLVIVGFVLWLWRRTPPEQQLAHLGFALVVSGALGNIIDRFVYGHVIDYVLFHTPSWSFAVFNLADACITVGAAFILLNEFLGTKKQDR